MVSWHYLFFKKNMRSSNSSSIMYLQVRSLKLLKVMHCIVISAKANPTNNRMCSKHPLNIFSERHYIFRGLHSYRLTTQILYVRFFFYFFGVRTVTKKLYKNNVFSYSLTSFSHQRLILKQEKIGNNDTTPTVQQRSSPADYEFSIFAVIKDRPDFTCSPNVQIMYIILVQSTNEITWPSPNVTHFAQSSVCR